MIWTATMRARKWDPKEIEARSTDELVSRVLCLCADKDLTFEVMTDQVDFFTTDKNGRRRRFATYMPA